MASGERLTISEAARDYGCSTAYLRELIARGKLVGRKVGPIWTVPASELARLKHRREQRAARKGVN